MFKKGRLVVGALLGVSVLCIGCNTNDVASNASNAQVDAKAVLKAASEKMSTAESFEMNMVMDMDMEVKDQGAMNMKMDMDAKYILNPEITFQIDSNIDMKMGEESQSIPVEQYIVKEDEQYVMYTGTMGSWQKTTMGGLEETEAMIQNPASDVTEYLNTIDDISFAGEKTINGIDCQEIKVNITKEYFEEALSELNILEKVNLDEASLDAALEKMGDIEDLAIYYYVGKETGDFVGYNMDVSELLKKIIELSEDGAEQEVNIIKVAMDVTVDNVNSVEAITLPEEVKIAAVEADY